jgi:hypothetical protein
VVDVVSDAHVCVARNGVLDRVREPLLHQPVGGQVDPGWEGNRLSLDLQGDRKPGLTRVRDEGLDAAQARLRCQCRGFLGVAQRSHHPSHLGEGLAAGSFHGEQGFALLLLLGS